MPAREAMANSSVSASDRRRAERLKMNTLGCFVDGKQLLVEADIMLGDRAW
jgi:hypothetical protein